MIKMKKKIIIGLMITLAISMAMLTSAVSPVKGINNKAIRDLGEGETDFWFAVVDSIEERWGGHWFNHYEFDDTIKEINNHPEVKFIISTGDNVVNPTTYDEARRKFIGLYRATHRYLDAPVIFTAGNHDIGSYGRYEVMKAWEDVFGALDFEFDYGKVHFVGVSNGNTQFNSMQTVDSGRYENICNMIDNAEGTLVFKHMVKVGHYPYQDNMWECEQSNAQAVFYGHYNQHEEWLRGNVNYIQTADAKDGHYRLVHVIDGEIVEMITG
jgi:predicted phosphodiesterase